MISGNDFKAIKNELLKLFPVVESVKADSQTFYLYLSESKKVILEFSKDYLEQHTFEEFTQHLQINIYFVSKSNINKTIHLLKNFEIEVSNITEDISYV